jgi:iron only hydrogenase large subunit-like protein
VEGLIAKGDRKVIVSISRQSLASLSAFYGIEMYALFRVMRKALKSQGIFGVCETSLAQNISLYLSYQELQDNISSGSNSLLLCSECPGWVCYAEKVVGDRIIPFMSKVKSPQ